MFIHLLKVRFNESAIVLAIVVLPTPGGPIKQSIGERISGFNILTAINCIILFFTLSIP